MASGRLLDSLVRVACFRMILAAACDPECVNGECLSSNVCTCHANAMGPTCAQCKPGWQGVDCLTRESPSILALTDPSPAICSAGCHMGSCSVPDTCDCFPRWTGALCDQCAAGWSTPAVNCTIGLEILCSATVLFRQPHVRHLAPTEAATSPASASATRDTAVTTVTCH